ncbi:unnamed protein product, partial [Adineta ricciae]
IFERIIIPFYSSSKSINQIKHLLPFAFSEEYFRKELEFYGLLEYYQTNDITQILLTEHTDSLSYLLTGKCLCQCIVNCVSCMSCAMGVSEMISNRCHHPRLINLLIGDVVLSLILLWTLFYEQYSDKILLKIRLEAYKSSQVKSTRDKLIVLSSCRSFTFIIQLIFASLSFIITLLSYERKNTWYFIIGLAFRHLLLIRLCLPDLCHSIDILYHNGRASFRVLSNFFLFFLTIFFICIWIGFTIYITDSSVTHSAQLTPSRYAYFVYHIILNVGYGDTAEKSVLSFVILILMTLIACPLLIIIYQNFIQELNVITSRSSHVETFHHTSYVNHLIRHVNRHRM